MSPRIPAPPPPIPRQYLADLPPRLLDGALAGLHPYTVIWSTVDAAITAVVAETPDTELQIGGSVLTVRGGEIEEPRHV